MESWWGSKSCNQVLPFCSFIDLLVFKYSRFWRKKGILTQWEYEQLGERFKFGLILQ